MQWTAMKDKLPTTDGYYDVWLYKNDPHMDCGEGRFSDLHFCDGEFVWSDDEPVAHVTHWMEVLGPNDEQLDINKIHDHA